MANKSDHDNKPFTDINKYLPEVYHSDTGTSIFDVAFNRHLTKDDTTRITGFIGEGNPAAIVDRRIKESTPHRQAFQLAPTMYSIVGTEETSLSFKAFQSQLELMGVDINRIDNWGSTLQFNWVPPINIDMLINFQDYFWSPQDPTALPQYLTIENRCNKARSKVTSYNNMLIQQGETFNVSHINYVDSEIVIGQNHTDLFTTGFIFYTKNSSNINMEGKFWTVVSSIFDALAGETKIKVINTSTGDPLVLTDAADPVSGSFVGEWFYNTSTSQLKAWTGVAWNTITQAISLTISLTERLAIFHAQANCACNQDLGWDIAQWDDNPTLWNSTLLAAITHATEADWITANGAPVDGDLWYDSSSDELKTYASSVWNVTASDFSSIIAETTGTSLWDQNTTCISQTYNQWSTQNRWIHKSELQSTSGVKRAQLPILEYDSNIELNEWVKATYSWKYRSETDQVFMQTQNHPNRIELEPIKGYYAEYDGSQWIIYLFHKESTMNRDIDYSDTFVPGYKFRITNDLALSNVYTVDTVEYREITSVDPISITNELGTDIMCTIVRIVEPVFSSIVVAGDGADVLHTRIEPTLTSMGDTWRGYHAHWVLDDQSITFSPTNHQRWNLYLQRSLDNVTALTPGGEGGFPLFTTDFSAGVVGIMHQEFTISASGITGIPLHPQLQYDAAIPQLFATPGSNEVRVYANDVRQYGNYTEQTNTGLPNYTIIGQTSYVTQEIEFVIGVTFDQPLSQFDVVRIEIGTASFNCMGNSAIPVRTVEDETEFTLDVVAGTQPTYRSMAQCYRLEQSKTILNQYPLFNTFDVATSEVVAATPIFGYVEDPDAAINTSIQRRIIASSENKEYAFEQYLVDRDDNIMYAYKNLHDTPTFWYSPLLNKAFQWDGYAWSDRVVVTVATGVAVRRIIVASTVPTTTLDQSLWFDTSKKKLFVYDGGNWNTEITDITINGTDPLLRTIWRHGLNDEQYVPSYVDANLTPVVVGDPAGDWEVVDQWMYNSEHHNRKNVSYTQLVTHFRTIIEQQPKIPGLQGGGIYTLSQEEFNYALGGTIKEHNDSFDTLISAVNVTNVTPVGVLEFASQEYVSSDLRLRDIYNKSVVELMTQYGKETFIDFAGTISSSVIASYETNDYIAQIYGDTSAYDLDTDVGVRNWIATIPMFGLGPKYRPHLSYDGNVAYLFHHDSHRSIITYTTAEQDRFSRAICSTPDSRVANGTLGVMNTSQYPLTESAFLTAFGGTELRQGVYWYRTGGVRKLYRLEAYDVSATYPSFYDTLGNEIPNGILYYNTVSNLVFSKAGLTWVAIAAAGDISPLWKEVSFAYTLGQVMLDIEERLYEVTPDLDLVFDYNSLLSELTVYNDLNKQRFDSYVASHDITAPLVNGEYDISDAFTWNYASCTFDVNTFPRIINGVETPAVSSYQTSAWQELYTRIYGTPYPHLEPWKLQGYYDKPTWWDEEYLDTTGIRRWKSTYDATITPGDPSIPDTDASTGMWENIRVGVVPSGRPYPDGTISSGNTIVDGKSTTMPMYRYFSVNMSDTTIGTYAPDALFPPYYVSPSLDPQVRSLFELTSLIGNASADYAFGDVGPTEWNWLVSAQHPYDFPVIAFLMQPAKFLHAAFGPVYTLVDELQVDSLFKQVYSHEDALFHGDVYDTNTQYFVRGINQWYVNYNRFTGFDTNAEFRELWVGWNPRMTYQFGGIVDTSSFTISNKYFDVSDQDYNIILANGGVIRDLWADAFEISLLSIPPAIVQYNNQNLWKMELDSLAAIPRTIAYYGVRYYPSTIDVSTDTFTANSVVIVGLTTSLQRIFVAGDLTATITMGSSIVIVGSTGNDGSYTVTSSVYDTNTNRTRLTVAEPIPSSIVDGNVGFSIVLPWLTGDTVVLSSSKFLPAPLHPNVAYYIIRLSTNTFQLAETVQDAIDGNAIDITTVGEGVIHAAQVKSSFNVFGGMGNTAELWFHYTIDTNDVRTFAPPTTIVGMQTLINIIDGYASYQHDQGLLNAGTDASDFDPTTGRLVDWDVETERFIDWAYGLRQSRIRVSDRYDASVNTTTSEFTFTGMIPYWLSGTAVTVISTGTMPIPLVSGAVYYIALTGTPGVVRLSTTSNALDTSAYVDITQAGSGQLSIGLYDVQRAYPRFELNPYRNNVWIDTPQGVLSNVIEGPYTDIRVQQTIFDQYSRPLESDRLTVLRQDKQSRIAIRPEIQNDVDVIYKNDPYNYIHVGGGHFFIEGYEHYLIFNDYTADGSLIYDSFLGLYAKRFSLDYLEKEDYTLRPTLGGYYLIDQQFQRNIEGTASDMQLYYDTLGISDTSEVARRARGLLGFKGRATFLDLLNVNDKSQFLFYRGMIQAKGSINSVNAYINSRRFVDAKIDEFWAWKVAEFGDAYPRVYPEIKLFADDALVDDIRLEFLADSESEGDADVVNAVNKGFQIVSNSTPERWYEFPEQRSDIGSPLFLDAEVSTLTTIYVGTDEPSLTLGQIDYWYDTDEINPMDPYGPLIARLKYFDGTAWVYDTSNKVVTDVGAGTVYVHYDICDDVRVIRKTFDASTPYTDEDYTTDVLVVDEDYIKVNSEVVRINSTEFTDIIMIFTINPAKPKISPAKLIDKKAGTVIQQVPLWDPAKGHHSPVAIHNVDLQTQVDPARYGYTPNPNTAIDNGWVENFWNQADVGTIWFDTSYAGYLPYYDDIIYPNINDRLYNWGKLAPWGDIKVYKWVQSTSTPEDWTGDGIPRQSVYVRYRNPAVDAIVDLSGVFTTVDDASLPSPTPVPTLVDDDIVIFAVAEGGTLPEGLVASFKYKVTNENISGPGTFKLVDPDTGEEVVITTVDDGTMTVIKAFDVYDWADQPLLHDRVLIPFRLIPSEIGTFTWTPSNLTEWKVEVAAVEIFPDTTIDLYKNGVLVDPGLTVTDNMDGTLSVTTAVVFSESDIVDIIRPVHNVTPTEDTFDPDTEDDGTALVQWKISYKYSMNTILSNPSDTTSSQTDTYYYFWVEQSTTRSTTSSLSTLEIAEQLLLIPTPCLIVQRPKDDPSLTNPYSYGIPPYAIPPYGEPSLSNPNAYDVLLYNVPILYREAIVRGITSYVNDDNRYVIRFTRDWSLRDKLYNGTDPRELKAKHEEWLLFRKAQMSTIPRTLWDLLTEALIGYKLADTTIRVPALERELYDLTYGTDTQYGLGKDQTFVDKTLGLATILAYLRDPTNDFSPTDIDNFFATYSFDTPAGIADAMNVIYTSFNAQHVNAMWFEVLQDSLSLRSKYKELLMTSWVALHGIRVLEVGGLFDD